MNLFTIASLSCGVSSVVLSVITLFFGKIKLHRLLLFFNIVVAFWGFGLFYAGIADTESKAILGWQIAHLGGFFIAPLFYHMICVICGIQRKKLLYFAYSQAIIFNLLNFGTKHLFTKTRFVYDMYYNDVSPLLIVGILLYIAMLVLSYYELLRFLPKAKGYKRTQTLYIIYGFMIGFLGGTSTFLPEFRIDILYPFGNFGITLYCFIVTYAILRYRLLDIHLIFKRTMAYSLSAGLLMGIFVVIVLTITEVVSLYTQADSFKISIFAAIIIALLFNPIRSKMQMLIDKLFYKKTYDYYETIRKVSHDLASMFDLNRVNSFVCDIVFSTLGLKHIYMLSVVPGGNYEVVYDRSFEKDKEETGKSQNEVDNTEVGLQGEQTALKLDKNSDIVKLMKTSDSVMVIDELPAIVEIIGQDTISDITNDLTPFNGHVLVPIFIDSRMEFLMVLGEKLSGDFFSDEDVKLLDTVSNQSAISIKNARLYGDKLNSERLASIGMMSATFAHEIRNPLTSLKTFAQLITEKYNDVDFRESFSKIALDDVKRIDDLIKDLLDFSSKKKIPCFKNIDLVGLVDETVEYVKSRMNLENKKIAVKKYYKNVKIDIIGDTEKLKQAIINIISNGCQAMDGEGTLMINVVQNAQNVDLTISDTGKGISHENLSKIFDPFYTSKTMGVGLGLAISRKIIEDHGGSITVNSRLLKGTTFKITFPMRNN